MSRISKPKNLPSRAVGVRKSGVEKYRAPALERGLDILELLATQPLGITQTRIAAALKNAPSENFRILEVLQRRGFVETTAARDGFRLTPQMFVLSQQFPPVQRLLDAALPRMRALAAKIGQSCHLAVGTHRNFLILAGCESTQTMSFTVRAGTLTPYEAGVSGRILLAFQSAESYSSWKASMNAEGETINWVELDPILSRIAKCGYEKAASQFVTGLTDVSVPIRGARGEALAALTVPYVSFRNASHTLDQAKSELLAAAADIQKRIGTLEAPFLTQFSITPPPYVS